MILRTILFAVFCLLIFGRCAQTVAPTGGKKDTIAPNLVESVPLNKTLNFKGNRIEMTFDEYVIIDNITQKLIITPAVENPYTFKSTGQTIILNFKKTFNDNTTYTLNFGDAIKDFAERNPAKNLKLVFSTGNSLDSGRVDGTVTDVRTNKPIFDALVGLYPNTDTLNPSKQKPIYFSRTDSSGHYSIENVQIRDYRLIAIDDKNRNMLYNTKDERIGFRKEPVSAKTDSLSYKLFMFQSDLTPLKIQRTLPKVNSYTVVFNKGVEQVHVNFAEKDTLPYLVENGQQIKFFNVQPHGDTTRVRVTTIDSLGYSTELPDVKIAFQAPRGKDRQKDPFQMTTFPESNKPLANQFKYVLTLNKPVQTLNASAIQLISDTLTHENLDAFTHTWNAAHNILTINARSAAKDSIKWDFPKGSFISVEGDTLARMFIKHPVLNEGNFGLLRGKVSNPDTATALIIELLDEQYKPIQTQTTATYEFKQIPQGKYFLRIIRDENRNGRWDSGDVDKGKQPEPIGYLPEKLSIKANFELNNIDISLPLSNTP